MARELFQEATPQRRVMTVAMVVAIVGVVIATVAAIADSRGLTIVGAVVGGIGSVGLLAALSWLRSGEITIHLPFVAFKFGLGTDDNAEETSGPATENHLTVVQQVSTNRFFIEVPPQVVQEGRERAAALVAGGEEPAAGGEAAVVAEQVAESSVREMVTETAERIGRVARPPSPYARPKRPSGAGQVHRPGERIELSGIYDVVDHEGRYLSYQEALTEDHLFPELDDDRAYGYVARELAVHMSPRERFLPNQRVPTSGIYDVVDQYGRYLDHQKVCRAGGHFPPFIQPLPPGFEGRDPKWYVLHVRAVPRCEGLPDEPEVAPDPAGLSS